MPARPHSAEVSAVAAAVLKVGPACGRDVGQRWGQRVHLKGMAAFRSVALLSRV